MNDEEIIKVSKTAALKVFAKNKSLDLDELVNEAYTIVRYHINSKWFAEEECMYKLNKYTYMDLRNYAISCLHKVKVTNYAVYNGKVSMTNYDEYDSSNEVFTRESLKSFESLLDLSKAHKDILEICENKKLKGAYKVVFFGYTLKEAAAEEDTTPVKIGRQVEKLKRNLGSSLFMHNVWRDLVHDNSTQHT